MPGRARSRAPQQQVAKSAHIALLARYATLDAEILPEGARFFFLETDTERIAMVSFSEAELEQVAGEPQHGLTNAEHSVLGQLILGHSNAAIARARRRSARTVANQVASIFRKLGVSSRRELLATFRDQNRPATLVPRRGPRVRDP